MPNSDSISRVALKKITPDVSAAMGSLHRRHLRAAVSTGARCVYRPAETVRWTVSQS